MSLRQHVPFLVSVLLVPLLSPVISPPALAAAGGLELSELLVDPAAPQTDAADEFVELHNMGLASIALGDYKLKVGTSATLHALPAQTVPAGGYVVLTAATSPWSLTNTGGTVTLLDGSGAEIDTTTWSKAVTGASWMKTAAGTWVWSSVVTPGAPNDLQSGAAGATPAPGAYAELELNELLPNPAAPLTDAADEFIELYNPNSEPVSTTGYIIKTGATLSTKHTLKAFTVPAGGYLALKSADTKITLSNAGSSVALFDPAGKQLGSTIIYGKAKAGSAWARFDDAWAWTSQPSPGAPNIQAAGSEAIAASKASGPAAAKTKSAAKTKAASAKAKAKAKTTKSSTVAKAAASAPGGSWLLFVLAGLTMAYVAYEFRHDLLNFYYRIRRHAGRRGPAFETPPGRGGD
jgi:hypothetical protein